MTFWRFYVFVFRSNTTSYFAFKIILVFLVTTVNAFYDHVQPDFSEIFSTSEGTNFYLSFTDKLNLYHNNMKTFINTSTFFVSSAKLRNMVTVGKIHHNVSEKNQASSCSLNVIFSITCLEKGFFHLLYYSCFQKPKRTINGSRTFLGFLV